MSSFVGNPGVPLTRGVKTAQSILAAATYLMDGPSGTKTIHCEGDSTLVVQVEMTGGASGDLAVAVTPFEADNLTVSGVAIPVVQSTGPTLSGGKVFFYAQYDISAVDAVQIGITNNNAGTQTINRASWRLQ